MKKRSKGNTKRQYLAGTRRIPEGEKGWAERQAEAYLNAQERRAKDAENPIKISEFKPADFWKD